VRDDNDPDMSVADEAAEHACWLLNRPGLRQVVQLAETIKPLDRTHRQPAPAIHNPGRPSATGSGGTSTP
jgi:hypothetical protein